MRRYFSFFLASGFCGLVYESVWIRLSMAQFGVTSASLSIVVSLFMAGLALGSFFVSRSERVFSKMQATQAARAYAIAELLIASFGLTVPTLLKVGGSICTAALAGKGPVAWYLGALASQAIILLPATVAMGATIPLGMHAIRKAHYLGAGTSFSYLYLANVLGAVAGALIPTFLLIEFLGFRQTLNFVLVLNLGIAGLAWAGAPDAGEASSLAAPAEPATALATHSLPRKHEPAILIVLFFTGLCSLGMEVVWTRQFTVLLGTFVYSFAIILATYLAATFAGSALYRAIKPQGSPLRALPWALVAALAALPMLATDPSRLWSFPLFDRELTIRLPAVSRLLFGIAPFSCALGFFTPWLVDRWSSGDESKAGVAYALNTIGCIIGPLIAGFVLLPWLSLHRAMAVLCAPFLLAAFAFAAFEIRRPLPWIAALVSTVFVVLLTRYTHTREDWLKPAMLERDHTATSVASGLGLQKSLMVNGVSMTVLTPITKMMAHLPLAMLDHTPERALTICFGMGTTFRSLNTWPIDVTAVELVPGVPKLFPYFHRDAQAVMDKPTAHIVIDDGRRFLQSDTGQYDVIIVDPPPPVFAASSSLLYSVEMNQWVAKRLAPHGIFQQWIPGGDLETITSMIKAIREIFPYLVIYAGQGQGLHLIASFAPFPTQDPAVLASKLSPISAADLIEWGPKKSAVEQFASVVHPVAGLEEMLAPYANIPELTDDRPINEYLFIRNVLKGSSP